ncbi:hypothetical protein UlMin_012688 [Ulmus minor]
MASHLDGSNRAFSSAQFGKFWLATIPQHGLEGTLGFDESTPFLDLTSKVYYDGNSFGMTGMAFHTKFAHNGRFYASFNCDKVKIPDCSGRCLCNTYANCDPSQLSSSYADQPCRFYKVKSAKPVEVRRIFTMGLTFPFNHGGQILFGLANEYFYAMVGDGRQGGDPFRFSQNKRSLVGKFLRIDIDIFPKIDELGTWENYSIPQDNPYSEDKKLLPEIWALGLRNPWRCSFDSKRPLYFIYADIGQVSSTICISNTHIYSERLLFNTFVFVFQFHIFINISTLLFSKQYFCDYKHDTFLNMILIFMVKITGVHKIKK